MTQDRPKILTVDDKPQNLFALEQILQKLDAEIVKADNGSDALSLVLENKFALAILDVQMPDMDGYELAALLRNNNLTADLPIIFVSAIHSDEYHHRKGYDSGAVDFMSKPFVPEILLSKASVFVELYKKSRDLKDLVDELEHTNLTLSRRTTLLETTNKLGEQITTILASKELLPQVASIIQMQFNFTSVGIWLISDDEQEITLETPTTARVKSNISIPVDHEGLVGKAYRTGAIALDNKAIQNQNFIPTPGLSSISSEMAVPIKFGPRTLGVLDVQSERIQAFRPDDEAALALLSTQIALAINNAWFYSEVLRLTSQLKQLTGE